MSILSLGDPDVLDVFARVRTHDISCYYLTDFNTPEYKNILLHPSNERGDKTQFDFIFADQIISQIEDPKSWFKKIYEFLKPAGILWIRTVYLENFKNSLSKKNRILINPPYRYYSSLTLEHLGKENGLEYVDTILEPLDTKVLLDTISENKQTGLLKPVSRYLVLLKSRKNIMNAVLHKPDIERKVKRLKKSGKQRFKRSA